MPITTDGVQVPPKSRNFTEQEARQAYEALVEGKNVGFGDFDNAGKARSAGNSLNTMIRELKLSDQKFAVTVFAVTVETADGTKTLHRGVMLPKPAKKGATGRKATRKSNRR